MTNLEIIRQVLELNLPIEAQEEMIWKLRSYKNAEKCEVFEVNEEGQLTSKTI